MAENKRFTLVKCVYNNWGLIDRSLEDVDQLVLIHTSKSSVSYLVNILNQLNDDNEQLKHQVNEQKRQIKGFILMKNALIDDCKKLAKEKEQLKSDLDYFKAKNGSLETGMFNLERENEQLKQQLNRLYNYFEDWYSDMTSANDFSEIWDNVKEDERWGDVE